MIRPGRLSQSWRSLLEGQRPIAANLLARVGAIGSLLLASLVVARIAGPAGVGTLVLLRVLPWLTGLVLSCGLYGEAIRLLPPVTIGDDELTRGLDALEAAVREAASA